MTQNPLNGSDDREARLAALLGALAPDDASDIPVPESVLAAFAVHAQAGQTPASRPSRGRRSGSRAWRPGRSAAVKAAIVILALSGGTVAAAAANVLPAPVQRRVHSILGPWGVPAPHTSPDRGNDSPVAPTVGTSARATSGAGHAQPSATRPAPASSASGDCSPASTHAADARCAKGTAATPAAGHKTKAAAPGHTASPHGKATH